MNRYRSKVALVAALCLAAGVTLRAGERPDLSGTWALNLAKSRLQVNSGLDAGTLIIDHKEPAFRFSRIFVAGGKEDASSYDLTTDGKEKTVKATGRTTTSRMYWDGDVLVLDEKIVLANGREATNVVR